MSTKTLAIVAGFVAFLACLSSPARCQNGADPPELDRNEAFLNFAYAAQLGIGRYEVGDLTATTLKLPISIPLRRGNKDRWGMSLKLPITAGRYEASDGFPGIEFLDQVDAVGVVPGIHFRVPVKPNWRLAPFLDVGLGKDLDTDRSAVLIAAGLGSRAHWPWKNTILTLGNRISWASNRTTDGDDSLSYANIETGLDLRLPPSVHFLGRENYWSVYFMNLYFVPQLDFSRVGSRRQDAVQLWEVGVTFGSDETRKILWIIPVRVFGIAYRFGDGFRGVRLTAGFPF